MLLRARSKEGTARLKCEGTDVLAEAISKWAIDNKINANTVSISNAPNGEFQSLQALQSQTVQELGLNHGDMIYLNFQQAGNGDSVEINSSSSKNGNTVKELSVDKELEKENGFINRTRSSLCKHGDKGMCEYCSPLPPWDPNYHSENKIKHISYHSYLKSLKDNSSFTKPLIQPNYKIKKRCDKGHEPWPNGICSSCQPSAITLKQQNFRMVDHVEFIDSGLINRFIDSWRTTGMQRFSYLYGTYEKYENEKVPLGIKAVVHAIYEPQQHDEQDGLTMEMDEIEKEMDNIDKIASQLGLIRIGLIFTDLTDNGSNDGSVVCKRHKDSFFLSSLEVIMAAKHQLKFRNKTNYSDSGEFSSKFVTCVVSGNLNNEIDVSAYQTSIEAESLVDATLISGSTHPSMAFINEVTKTRYVPEIFYMRNNEYKLTVKENAKPAFPVEYLLVSLTHGFNTSTEKHECIKFKTLEGFPWANRQAMGLSQDYHELKSYLLQAAMSDDLQELQSKISNFHFLIYIHSLDILSAQEWSWLLSAATAQDFQESILQLMSSPGWQTMIMILQNA